LPPRIAEILREEGGGADSAFDAGMLQASDLEQLEYAISKKRCVVTRNRNDFIRLPLLFFNENRPHHGVHIVPYSYLWDRFSQLGRALRKYALNHKKGMSPFGIDFL